MKARIVLLALSIALLIGSCVTGNSYAALLCSLLTIVIAIWAEWDGFKTKKDLNSQIEAANQKIKSYDTALNVERDNDEKITGMHLDFGVY